MQTIRNLLAPVTADRYLQALIVLGASLAVAWVTDWILTFAVRRLTRRTRTEVDDRLITVLHRPIRTSVVLVGLATITLSLRPPAPGAAAVGVHSLTGVTLSLLATVAIVLWTTALIRVGLVLLEAATHSPRVRFVEVRTLPLFSNLARVVMVGLAVYFVFVSWDIDVRPWLASAGIVGIAIGFAAKDTLANLFAGIFILADAPYSVGDFINLDGGERGRVTHVGIRSTRLLTRDDVEITLPNSVIGNAMIINESGGRWTRERVRVKVGVAYGSDVDQVRRVMEQVARDDERVCAEPEPRVRFRQFGDSSLDFELLAWIDEPVLRGQVIDALNTALYKAFAAEGIEIPFPQRDLHLKTVPPGLAFPKSPAADG